MTDLIPLLVCSAFIGSERFFSCCGVILEEDYGKAAILCFVFCLSPKEIAVRSWLN